MLLMSVQARWLLGIAVIGVSILSGNRALAQITPDRTLPNNSIVTPNGKTFNITGGTQAGANLFHSFQEFSVPTGGTAFFNNALDIRNIITRVTGGNISNIDGLIRTLGTANLFLINPNGIVFGPNASLNVGGSFVASSANAIQFGNQGFFSATNPDASAPLLTINPSALFFNQSTIAAISNSSVAPAGIGPTGADVTGLRVPDGQSLLLVGGDVNINGGSLRAYGGRVSLAGLAAPGTVGLNVGQNILTLSLTEDVQRANVSLSNGASVNVRAQDGGSIAINAQNVSLTGGSILRAGIESGLGTPQSKAGDIVINAKGETVLSDGSFIANVVNSNAVGQAGDINITTGGLTLSSGGQLNTSTFGRGNGGNVSVMSSGPVSLVGGIIFDGPDTGAVGNGGNVSISARSVTLTSGSQIDTSSAGLGNGGNIIINARDTVAFDGVDSNGIPTRARTALLASGEGIAGDIKITTGSLFLSNGAIIIGDTFGKGNGGSITINARDTVNVDGFSFVSSSVDQQAVGNGGDIRVTTGSLSLTNGADLKSNVQGQGNGGNITIDARDTVKLDGIVGNASTNINSDLDTGAVGKGGDIQVTTGSLSATNGAQLSTNTNGRGNAGNIIINARDTVTFDGAGNSESSGPIPSLASTVVGSNGIGNGGDIRVSARELLLKNDGQLGADSFGQGKGGNIQINVSDTVTFDGTTSHGSGSGAYTLASGNSSKAGDIFVTTGTLSLTNGGILSANAYGFAGNITINARDAVIFDGTNDKGGVPSGASTSLLDGSPGKGGDINITTGSLTVRNGAQVNTATSGQGNAGNIIIDASGRVSFDGTSSTAFSTVSPNGVGKGGDIRISADSLSLTNGARLRADTLGKGDAGNVIIDARGNVSFDGTSSDALSRVEQTGVGKGGDIRISADSLSLTNGAQLLANTLGKGDAGNIEINAPNSVSVKGTSSSKGFSSALFTSTDSNSTGSGGNITVNTPLLRVSDGAGLDARTANNRNGGNITLNVKQAEILNGGELIALSSGAGNAGKITVNATDQVIVDGSDSTFNTRLAKFGAAVDPVDASSGFFVRSQSTGSAGDINVTSPQIRLDNEARFIAESASGSGGNINLQVKDLLLLDHGSLISTSAGTANAGGDGGNITINTPNGFIVAFPDESSNITANAYTGIGGRVQINATGVYGIQFRDQLNPLTNNITASSEFGSAGTVQLNIPNNDLTQGLAVLQSQLVNVDNLIANSCIVRTHQKQEGTFFITGSGGLPNRPGDVSLSSYPTGEVRSLPGRDKGYRVSTSRPWHKGDPIVEPQGVYQLPNGHLVLSRECNS